VASVNEVAVDRGLEKQRSLSASDGNRRILLKNSLVDLRLIFAELNLQGSDLIRSRRAAATNQVRHTCPYLANR
jgi:hypothetical protein